ncbi:hypothetical protein V6Z12_D06G257200 [Gossypium hirsutum]
MVQSERVSGLVSVKCAVASAPKVWKIVFSPIPIQMMRQVTQTS